MVGQMFKILLLLLGITWVQSDCSKEFSRIRTTGRAGWSGTLNLVQREGDNGKVLAQKEFQRPEFFEKDAAMMNAVKGLRGVAQILKVCNSSLATPSLIMEYYPEQDPSRSILTPEQFRNYFRKLVMAIKDLASRNISHLDIKSDNIVATADGTPVLIDFNLARFWNDTDFWVSANGPPELYHAMQRNNFTGVLSAANDVYDLARHISYVAKDKPAQMVDLLNKMMEPIPEKRILHDEILAHPYFASNDISGSMKLNGFMFGVVVVASILTMHQ